MFSFGKNKTEARITGEFYTNAIHVMEGASLLGEGEVSGTVPQCPPGMDPASFKVFRQLCGAAGRGGVPHRVLGAGRGEDSPPAAGEGIEPARGAGGGRSQRHWARSGAAGRIARRACVCRRPQRGRRGARGRARLAAISSPEFTGSSRRRHSQPRIDSQGIGRGGAGIRRHRHSHQHCGAVSVHAGRRDSPTRCGPTRWR